MGTRAILECLVWEEGIERDRFDVILNFGVAGSVGCFDHIFNLALRVLSDSGTIHQSRKPAAYYAQMSQQSCCVLRILEK